MPFASVYPLYIAKAERKGRTKAEVDEIILWLTGYSAKSLDKQVASEVSFQAFFDEAPKLNPSRKLITGVICGIRVEEYRRTAHAGNSLPRQTHRRTRKGKSMDKILRV